MGGGGGKSLRLPPLATCLWASLAARIVDTNSSRFFLQSDFGGVWLISNSDFRSHNKIVPFYSLFPAFSPQSQQHLFPPHELCSHQMVFFSLLFSYKYSCEFLCGQKQSFYCSFYIEQVRVLRKTLED